MEMAAFLLPQVNSVDGDAETMDDVCDWKGCKRSASFKLLGREICQMHFDRWCKMQESDQENNARSLLGLPPIDSVNSTPDQIPGQPPNECECNHECGCVERDIATIESSSQSIPPVRPRKKMVRKKRRAV